MKVALLISGGVDSAVALRLLQEQGHDVTAFYLKIWLAEELSHLSDCPWQDDIKMVERICALARVPFKIISLQKEYRESIVEYLIDSVVGGFTPNPDMLCNQSIKFGVFYKRIDPSFDYVATGHYAQRVQQNGTIFLARSPDPVKDQTYFLARLNQQQLIRALFPIGHLQKKEVRRLAAYYALPNKDRKDSQGICFLGKVKFDEFVRHYIGENIGDLVEFETGKKVGTHPGFWFYTIGQRKGFKLSDGPWYVVRKDTLRNIIYVSNRYFSSDKKRNRFRLKNVHWIAHQPSTTNLTVKLRHGPDFYSAKLDIKNKQEIYVTIDRHDQGIAPGQFAVFYNGAICLGSGLIDE